MGLKSFKLADFGMDKFIRESYLDKITLCSTFYKAPEIISNEPYGKECDYWSIGVLIYVMLSGEYPFMHKNFSIYFQKIQNAEL